MNTKTTIAIIGYGKIGKIYENFLRQYGFQILICDNAFGEIVDYKDSKLLVADIVFVTTPPLYHFEISKYFLSLGKKVVLEKPPVISKQQQNIIVSLEKQDNLYCAYHTLFNPLFEFIEKYLNIKELVKIEILNKEYIFNYHNKDSWILDPKISGGGCLIDNGINVFSVLLSYVDILSVVRCELSKDFLPVEDNVSVGLLGKNKIGEVVKIEYSSKWYERSIEERRYIFHTKENVLDIDLAKNIVKLNDELISNNLIESQNVLENEEYEIMVKDIISFFDIGVSKIKYDKFAPLDIVFSCYNFNLDN
jgi:predicted dehydrogenase